MYIIEKNKEYKTMKSYRWKSTMSGKAEVYLDITLNLLDFFKYAPITSVEVERICSLYKHILSDNRFNFNCCMFLCN
jgi:DNA-binding ferritin-like protein (Dps family)